LYKKSLSPEEKTLLFALDRLERYKNIMNENPDVVIWDRYIHSALVYRKMEGLDEEWVSEVNKIFKKADIIIYLDIDVEEALERGRKAQKKCPYSKKELEQCRKIYMEYVEKGDMILIEAKDKSVKEIAEKIFKEFEQCRA